MEKILVLGGARSGKSTFAESVVRDLPDPGPVTYVATARPRPGDPEWADRVRRHRERRPASWETRETTEVASVLHDATGTVIVECLALWLTAVLDDAGAWDDDATDLAGQDDGAGPDPVDAAVAELVDAWRSSQARIVAVSNEVGWGVVPATRSGRLFRDLLGTLNQRLAGEAHRVVLCVAGRALELPSVEQPGGRVELVGESGPERAVAAFVAAAKTGGLPVASPSVSAPTVTSPEPGRPARIDRNAEAEARERIDALAKPVGSLGRLEDVGVWLAGRQGGYPLRVPSRVRVTVFAGDHGVATETSAYPPAVTGAMVCTVATGQAAVNALAAEHGATVRVRDLGVNADLGDLPADVTEHKVSRGTGRVDVEDALTRDQVLAAVAAGRTLAADQPADLLVAGDLGIGNTTIAAAVSGVVLGVGAEKVTGRGTGVDDATLHRKTAIVDAAIERARPVRKDPVGLLAAVGGPDIAAMAGFLAGAAEQGVPVLLDGVVVTAAALVAELLTPGASAWWLAGHRSVEPAHSAALDHLGLEPIVDLRMRLGEGTGAVAALPTLRSAVAMCTRMAALADLDLG